MLQPRVINSVRLQCRRSPAVLFVIALILGACLPSISVGQTWRVEVRVNQEVRVYNDIDHTMVEGRVVGVTSTTLNVVRHMDTPALRIPWTEIHRLEIKNEGIWKSVQLVDASNLLNDSSWAAGSAAGAAAARAVKSPGFFGPAFLSAVPFGFFGLFLACGDCDATPRVFAAAGLLGIGLTVRSAGARSRKFPPTLEQQIAAKPEQYQAGYRTTYEKRLASRFKKQAWGGAALGTVVGFGALVYAFRNYD